jgi:hypothetical protein
MQTEYQRRDIEPKPAGQSLLHDKHGMPRVTKKVAKKVPPPPELPNEPIRVHARRPDEDSISYRDNIPPQPMAHVGMHEDTMWFDEELVAGETPSEDEEMIDNNEEMDIERLQRPDPARDVELRRPPRESWVERMEPGDAEPPERDPYPKEEVEEIERLGFDLDVGEYAILMNGQLIVKYSDIEHVRTIIEDMIFNHNIDVSAISLVRNVPIKFGLFFKDE